MSLKKKQDEQMRDTLAGFMATELKAVKDGSQDVKKPNIDVQFPFIHKPFGTREYFIILVSLCFIQ